MERLIGKVFAKVTRTDDEILFDDAFKLFHSQDCCEDVHITDICGDLSDLEGATIVESSEEYQDDPNASESGTWSFYKIGSTKGSVTIRFHGSSNGYYGETANLHEKDAWGW
jgi:hypothetical protein